MWADSLARMLQSNNHHDFGKEVEIMNNFKTPLAATVEGVCGQEEIAKVWHEHCFHLFNCVKSNALVVDNVDLSDDMGVRASDVCDAIMMLEENKACSSSS